MAGTVYLVATPIGNLKDISERALETLRNADIIACEDTRHSRKLLTHYGITNKLKSYHEYNEDQRNDEFEKYLQAGKSIAVISDAGTPGISDPGFSLVARAWECGAEVVAVPGPVAFVCAAILSALPTDSLFFGGFLPSRQGERRRRLEEVKGIPATLIFYESPHRIRASLADCLDVLGDRRASIARELTKVHEQIVHGKLSEMIARFSDASPKGEFVLVVERASEKAAKNESQTLPERVAELEGSGIDRKIALKTAAKEFGLSKSEAYRQLLEIRS